MSDFIDRLLREARLEVEDAEQRIADAQVLIAALEPKPKTRRRRSRREPSAEARELAAGLRVTSMGIRPAEREQLRQGERAVAYVTTGGRQDG